MASTLLQHVASSGNREEMARAYLHLANATDKLAFDTTKAHEYALQGESFLDESTSLPLKLRLYSILATTTQAMRDFLGAQRYYLQALAMVSEKDLEQSDKELQELYAILNYNICILYNHIGMFRFGYDYLLIAEKYSRIAGFERMISYCELSIASYYYHIKDYDRAIILLTAIAEEKPAPDERIAIANIYAGDIHFHYHEYEKALHCYEKALDIRRSIGNEIRYLFSYEVLAKVHYRLGQKTEGDRYFEELKTLAGKYRELYTESHLNQIYFTLYGEGGNYQKAYEYALKNGRPATDPKVTEEILKTFFQQEKDKQHEMQKRSEQLQQLNEQMQQHAQQLELSNKDLTSYAHTTSHDLREPLRMISTYMTILESKLSSKLTEDEQQFLRFAVDGSKRMDDMIAGILNAAKSGPAAKKPIELNRVIAQVRQNLSGLMARKNAFLHAANLPVIGGDEIQVIQVFQNLISNAFKYNRSEVPEVNISFVQEGADYIISVADNGVGIPESERKRAFELYERIENNSGADGTGIGLSTVKNIITKMGGEIWIEGNSPSGSVFKLRLKVRS